MLPIQPNEPGIRHYGFYAAHAEYRCYALLRERAERAETELASLRAELAERKEMAISLVAQFDAERCKLLGECNGLREQHARDSAELRSLCAARDDARKQRDTLRAELERVQLQHDSLKAALHDEITANLAFREKGGALPDEDMPTFCDRLIAERQAATVNADKFLWLEKRYFGADFAYGESKRFVILFSWPESAQISSNLTTSIEAAQLEELFDGKVRIDGEKA